MTNEHDLIEESAPSTDDGTNTVPDIESDKDTTPAPPENELVENDEGEKSPDGTKRAVIWAVFGVVCLLALIIPAGVVLYRAQHAVTAQNDNVTVIPAPGTKTSVETTSTESTKTASSLQDETDTSASQSDALGQDLENWDYYRSGRNIMEPVKGPRVGDSSSAINKNYIVTIEDALDIDEHAANGVTVTPPQTAKPTGATSVAGANDSTSSYGPPPLEGVGTSNGKKVAVFVVGGTTYEAKVGETIGKTTWSVKSIGAASATVTDGTLTRTLKINDGSK
ncbi:MAG: hypothetical protein JJE36_02220 [Coriobacteriia bacterium]|nr:hypothetical protein [Coriobacteriia bacterium]